MSDSADTVDLVEGLDRAAPGLLRAVLTRGGIDAYPGIAVLMDAIGVPVFAKGTDLRYTFVNAAFLAVMGLEAEDVIGHTPSDLVPADQAANFQDHDRSLLQRGGIQRYEAPVRIAGGRMRDFIFHKTVVRDGDGTAIGLVGVMLDVTDKNRLREELDRRNRDLRERMKELNCLYEVSSILGRSSGSVEVVLDAILPSLCKAMQHVGDARARISWNGMVRESEGYRAAGPTLSATIPSDLGLPGLVEVAYAGRMPEADNGPFLREEQILLTEVARILGLWIDGEMDDRAAQLSESRYRAMFDQATIAMCHMDGEGTILRANDRACVFWQFDRDALHERKHSDLVVSYSAVYESALLTSLRDGNLSSFSQEIEYQTGGGARVWGRLTLSPLRDPSGAVVYYVAMIEETTEEHALRRREHDLSQQVARGLRSTVRALSNAQESRDPYTAGHQHRVARLSVAIGERMGMDEKRLRALEMGAFVHDIGKLRIPADLLAKPGRLLPAEFELIKTHAEAGSDILSDTDIPDVILDIVRHHHERLDGSGYPDGLAGEELSLEVRIIGVADTVEAVTSHRPYRAARGLAHAREVLSEGRGTIFDAEVTDVCLALMDEKTLPWLQTVPETAPGEASAAD
jgi:PAS domain S-box-containing protein